MGEHFWLGSLCRLNGSANLPPGVIAVTDTITIARDLGNRIPDRSWMLYLLEAFDRRAGVPVELNLICQFNDRDNFWAILGGVNRYKFTKVLPEVGHTYLRQIVFQRQAGEIEYALLDRTSGLKEDFSLGVKGIAFEAARQFTGVEWWNMAGRDPFPVRYRATVSELMCGQADGQGITYVPYSGLSPDKDPAGTRYPVAFERAQQGGISYTVTDGMTDAGMGH